MHDMIIQQEGKDNSASNIKDRIVNQLQEEHGGFAITFEVICTMAMLTTMIFLTLFLLMTMNAQRYMHTVLTTTASEASRWGGNNTRAYQLNVDSSKTIQQNAQENLQRVVSQFNPVIRVTPEKISVDGEEITVELRYSIWEAFKSFGTVQSPTLSGWGSYDLGSASGVGGTLGGEMRMSINVSSIMKVGTLL